MDPRPQLNSPRNRYVYSPGNAPVPEWQAVNVTNRSFVVGALVDIPGPGAEGVIFAHGSRFGGHALYVKDNRLHYVNNFVGAEEQLIVAGEELPTGEQMILSELVRVGHPRPPSCPRKEGSPKACRLRRQRRSRSHAMRGVTPRPPEATPHALAPQRSWQ
jgi:hypothetical protein